MRQGILGLTPIAAATGGRRRRTASLFLAVVIILVGLSIFTSVPQFLLGREREEATDSTEARKPNNRPPTTTITTKNPIAAVASRPHMDALADVAGMYDGDSAFAMLESIDGDTVPMARFAGKVTVVVNVASF